MFVFCCRGGGTSSAIGSTVGSDTPVQVSGSGWASASLGEFHTLGLKTDGTLWAWGDGGSGELGNGSNQPGSAVPVQVPGGNHWVSSFAGFQMSAGLKDDGTLWAWGSLYGLTPVQQ